METKTWTEDGIIQLLTHSDRAVERAMVAIYKRQTADEQASATTQHHNSIGFSAFDAKNGSYYAKWVLSGRRLNGTYLEKARRIAVKYRKQLLDIANSR